MVEARNIYIAERSEYRLRVPKVPRQSVDVFGRDVRNGDYGLSVDKIDVLLSYVRLQQTLDSFDDLTFSPEFLDRLPAEFRRKLGDNIFSGIALADLELPTTDKILLARMLVADRLTETLSQAPVEVWVTPQIQKDLGELGLTTGTGLQQIDYGQSPLRVKHELVEVMERQEAQVHTILAARQHFPEGILPPSFSALLSGQRERVVFNTLTDLESQYTAAQQVLDNPLLAWAMSKKQEERRGVAGQRPREEEGIVFKDPIDQRPIKVEEEAKGDWWDPREKHDYDRYRDAFAKVAAYLRPQYAGRSIYEILGADTEQDRDEVLAAFWRTGKSRRIDFGDESFMFFDLYLKPDGNLELHFHDEAFGEREKSTVTGTLTGDEDVAMVDQAIKWIKKEMAEMQEMRKQWEGSGFSKTPLVEVTFATALGLDRPAAVREEINGLPGWFVEALNQETEYFNRLFRYIPQFSIDDILSLVPIRRDDTNRLKLYFDLSNATLERDRRLISNPEELYKDLGLDPSADVNEVKRAYRRIAQETRAIHVSSPEDFNAEEWGLMNERFKAAARVYAVLSRRKLGETRVTTLGRLTQYFDVIE